MGAGIAITRGAAGALSFCMAVVLLTVCRNVITLIRETPMGEFIPFDSAITFHKVSWMELQHLITTAYLS
ncbi:unnamed protein product [Cylicostephanus goldi]|uniref:Uncharacterized protein n=1 Tax=Cylicostephanus goldi TaxID=71465 RepID=A0A3P6RVA1_CYLGO|nr:unnamed protein product [Cylicostephanus goldi]